MTLEFLGALFCEEVKSARRSYLFIESRGEDSWILGLKNKFIV